MGVGVRKAHHASEICSKSELAFWSPPPTQLAILESQWVSYPPFSSLRDEGMVEFKITGSESEFVDLAQTFIHVTCNIVKPDGTALGEHAKVGPVNNVLHSLFQNVEVLFNETLVSGHGDNYALKSYLANLLTYGREAKETQLTTVGWEKDTAAGIDASSPYAADGQGVAADTAGPNAGLLKRAQLFAESRDVQLIGKLNVPLANQPLFLLNNVNVLLRLHRTKSKFALMTSTNHAHRLKIKSAVLFVRKVKLAPAEQLRIETQLISRPALYPLTATELKLYSYPAGVSSIENNTLFSSYLPEKIVLGFVRTAAIQGDYHQNPYNFLHLNLTHLVLLIDGKMHPATPYTPDYSDEESTRCVREYLSLFTGTGQHGLDSGNDVSLSDYKSGYTLYCFDLTTDLAEGTHWNSIRTGNVRLECRFGAPFPNPITMFCYSEFNKILELNREREPSYAVPS